MLRSIVAMFLAAVVSITGCRKGKSDARTGGGKTPSVEGITDPTAIEAARKAWAERREQTPAEDPADPSQIRRFDREKMTLLEEQRDRSIRTLRAISDEASQPPERRVHALASLSLLNVAPDPSIL